MKAVLFYETGATPMAAFGAAFPRHKLVYEAFATRGEVLGIGTFAGGRDGSMAIFRDRDAAEAFVKQDPFVLEGLVAKYSIKDWNDTLIGCSTSSPYDRPQFAIQTDLLQRLSARVEPGSSRSVISVAS
jgi:uncharacterized protein YciI